MKLDYALLASTAERLADGRICIIGGDISGIEVSETPLPFGCAIVVHLLLFPEETEAGHKIHIEVTSPDGERKKANEPVAIKTTRNKLDPELPSGASIIINLGTLLPMTGKYTFHIVVDAEELKSIPFYVNTLSPEKIEKMTK